MIRDCDRTLVPIRRATGCGLTLLAFCLATGGIPGVAGASTVLTPRDEWVAARDEPIDAEYELSWRAPAWNASNRAHDFRASFDESGIHIAPRTATGPSWQLDLALIGYGRDGVRVPAGPAAVTAVDNQIEYDRGDLLEWYINDAAGLEQGFTLRVPPEEVWRRDEPRAAPLARDRGPLQVDLVVAAGMEPIEVAGGQQIEFAGGAGLRILRYAGLVAWDARGRELPARMERFEFGDSRGVRLIVDDRSAVYPLTIDPVVTSAAWIVESDVTGARLGSSLATAGDVNGDGYDDIIVGAPGHGASGRTFVYFGGASGLPPTPDWSTDASGAVSTAGDVNGDGYDEVFVGSAVFFGSPGGPSAAPDWIAPHGPGTTAGDVNGDGFDDVIVRGPFCFHDHFSAHFSVEVYLGSSGGLEATPVWAECESAGPFAFATWGPAGDVNGDGYDDVAFNQIMTLHSQTNSVALRYGSPSGISGGADLSDPINEAIPTYGSIFAAVGDVNGDLFDDILVGWTYLPSLPFNVLHYGSATGVSPEPFYYGHHSPIAGAGDLNGDGFDDVLGGDVPPFGTVSSSSAVSVYKGGSTGLSPTAAWAMWSDTPDTGLGEYVAAAGDVNGDGFADVLLGAPRYGNVETEEGRLFVFHGSSQDPADGDEDESEDEDLELTRAVEWAATSGLLDLNRNPPVQNDPITTDGAGSPESPGDGNRPRHRAPASRPRR